MRYRTTIVITLISSLLLGGIGLGNTNANAQRSGTPTPQPERDQCEANENRESPCTLSVDSVSGPYTFAPRGDQDWYRLDLGTPTGLVTVITVRPGGVLDLLTTITRDDGTPVTAISSPTISATLGADVVGGIVLRVENRSPNASQEEGYTIEVRRNLPPAPIALPDETDVNADALENNWDFRNASPVGIGVIYDLNFVCPIAHGCGGGDHDYLQVPVKRGSKYIFATFDLGPGTDTVLDLYWGTEIQPIASNDDAGPVGFASIIRWVAPFDGYAVLRVGPRSGSTQPTIDDDKAGTYRFAVAIQGTQLANDIVERVKEQTTLPTPTPTVRPAPPSSGGGGGSGGGTPPAPPVTATPVAATPVSATEPVTTTNESSTSSQQTAITDGAVGPALVIAESTDMRVDPKDGAEILQTLQAETIVVLTGKGKGAWVRVTTGDGVMPGWIKAQDLRRLVDDAPTPIPGVPLPQSGAEPKSETNTNTSLSNQPFRIISLDPVPPKELPQVTSRTSIALAVTLIVADGQQLKPTSTTKRETPAPIEPIGNVRVQLVNIFDDVLAEARTTSTGTVQFNRDITTNTALFVRIPATGLSVRVKPEEPAITIAIPKGQS